MHVALLICLLPTSWLRVRLYRLLCRYEVSPRARLGFGTLIAVAQARIGAAHFGRFNRLHGPCVLEVADGAHIGSRNAFTCGDERGDYGRYCRIGRDTLITSGHYIDVLGGFELGDRSWIAGYASQVWTHGIGVVDRAVHIGTDCYIGSAARFAPGSRIGNVCLVALGSVVANKFGDNLLLGGVPARVLAENHDWRERYMRGSAAAAAPTA